MKEDKGDPLEDATFFAIVGALYLLLFSLRVVVLGPPLRPAALRRYALGLAGLLGPSGYTSFRLRSGPAGHPAASLGQMAFGHFWIKI